MLTIVLVLSALSGISGAGAVALIGQIFNSADYTLEQIPQLKVVLFVLLILAMLGLEFVTKWAMSQHSERIVQQLRLKLSRCILSGSLKRTESQGIATLVAIYTQDVKFIGTAFDRIPAVGVGFFAMLGSAVYLIWLSWKIVLLLTLLTIPAAFVYFKLFRYININSNINLDFRNDQVDLFKSLISGMKELQLDLNKIGRLEQEYLVPSGERYSKSAVRLAILQACSDSIAQFVFFGSMIVVFVVVVAGYADVTLLAPFFLVTLFVKSYIFRIVAALPAWTYAGVILKRIDSICSEYQSKHGASQQRSNGSFQFDANYPKIEIKQLVYTYYSEADTKLFTVGPINIDFEKPEVVFIVGNNGSGKTTFLKLLSGLYPIESGSITCNEQVVDSENIVEYRQLFSVIFTHPHIFNEIHDFNRYQDEETLIENLDLLQLHEKVSYENGLVNISDLSQGQQKRAGLLLSMLEDKPIVVFDEWGENQDPLYKNIFYYKILPELRSRGKIVIVVTHETQYFQLADRVVDLINTK